MPDAAVPLCAVLAQPPQGLQFQPGAAARRWAGAAVCVLAGLLQALSGGWPGSAPHADLAGQGPPVAAQWAWLLQLLGVVLFAAVTLRPLRHEPNASARGRMVGLPGLAAQAALFGLAWQLGATWWLTIGLHRYAGLSAPLSVAAVLALGSYLAVYSVLAMVLWAHWARPLWALPARGAWVGPVLRAVMLAAGFAAAWLLAELGRAMVLTGFPWALGGYAHVHGPFRGLAPWLGVYGTAAASAFVAALCVQLWWSRRRPAARWAGLLLLAGAALLAQLPQHDFTRSTGAFEVVLLQGNIAQDRKFDVSQVASAVNWHVAELTRQHADLAVAPETAVPVLEQDLPAEFWSLLQRRVDREPGVLLIGMPHRAGPQAPYNALVGLGHIGSLPGLPASGSYRYLKSHLVPFAEFTPPGFAWFTRRLDLPLPAFAAGPALAAPLHIRTRSGPLQVVAPLICFEDLYGEEVAARFRDPQQAPTALVNASNLAWFDDSPAQAQHLRIAQFRSLEFQRPTLRATNTGPTVVIDHQGLVTHALAPHTRGVLGAVVDGRQGLTPYAWWVSRSGLWPLLLLAFGLLWAPQWARLQRLWR